MQYVDLKKGFQIVTYIPALLAAATPDGASSNTKTFAGSTFLLIKTSFDIVD